MKFGSMRVDNDLWSFVRENHDLDGDINALSDAGIDRLLGNSSLPGYDQIDKKIQEQNIRYEVIKKELIALSKQMEAAGITMVVLKGVPLAYELYAENPGMRKSKDMDVLFSPLEIDKALRILGVNGYYVYNTNERVSEQLVDKYRDKMTTSIHYPQFAKNFVINGEDVIIHMDCHLSIVHILSDRDLLMDQMVHRAVGIDIGEGVLCALEIHDRILHLMLHLSKEYFRNLLRWTMNGERKFHHDIRFPLNLLHEIARMIELYDSKIVWDMLFERTEQFGVEDEVYVIVKLLNDIYKSIIPAEVINDKSVLLNTCSQKLYGWFYPLAVVDICGLRVLQEASDEIAEIYLKSIHETDWFVYGKEYPIQRYNNNTYVQGCEIVEKAENEEVGKVTVERISLGFLIKIKDMPQNLSNENLIITCGQAVKNEYMQAYINRYIVNLSNFSSQRYVSVCCCNAFSKWVVSSNL